MDSHNKFEPLIEANCRTITDLVRLKGINIETFTLLFRHFASQQIPFDDSEIECQAGCGFCCSLKVTASIPEILIIMEFINKNSLLSQHGHQPGKYQDKYPLHLSNSNSWWVRNSVSCLFLDQDTQLCRIYDVRPFTCRGYHSLDSSQCEKGFLEKRHVPIPCFPDYKRCREIYSISFDRAMHQLGKQSGLMVLSSMVSFLLSHPESVDDWYAGREIFNGG